MTAWHASGILVKTSIYRNVEDQVRLWLLTPLDTPNRTSFQATPRVRNCPSLHPKRRRRFECALLFANICPYIYDLIISTRRAFKESYCMCQCYVHCVCIYVYTYPAVYIIQLMRLYMASKHPSILPSFLPSSLPSTHPPTQPPIHPSIHTYKIHTYVPTYIHIYTH